MEQRNQLIQGIVLAVEKSLRKFGVSATVANGAGEEIADALATKFGGIVLHIPVRYSAQHIIRQGETPPRRLRSSELYRRRFFKNLDEITTPIIQKIGLEGGQLAEALTDIINELCFEFKGQNLSFPKDKKYKTSLRNDLIISEFNGQNHAELAAKYDVTIRTIYRVLNGPPSKH